MATFTLEELITPVTRQEVQAKIYEVLAAVGVNTTVWKPGSVVRTMILGASIVLAALSELQARIARSGFLELSEGDWLTAVAHYVYGVDRFGATFATGQVTLTNSGGGVFSLDPGDLIVGTGSGKTYRNTEAFTLGASTDIDVDIQATEVGSESSALPDTITSMVTTLTNVTCTNESSVLGQDEESDAGLRLRCSAKLGSLSPMGPWDAYSFAIRNATRVDGSSINVNRIRILKDGTGLAQVFCATPSGELPGDPDDPETDLGIAAAAVAAKAVPLGFTVEVDTATAVPVAVTYEVWMYNTSGRTNVDVQTLISTSILQFIQAQPVGGNVIGSDPGKVFLDGLRAAIKGTLPEIFHVVVTLPAADVVLAATEVATNGIITPTDIHQEPPPEGFGA